MGVLGNLRGAYHFPRFGGALSRRVRVGGHPPYLVKVQLPPAPFGEGVILNPYGDIDRGNPE